jgi:hypothetical protein
LFVFFPISLFASAPGEFNYQGKLADSTGNPLTGSYDFQFQICDTGPGTGGACLPTSPLTFTSIPVNNGVFNVVVTGVTTDMLPGTGGFLEVSVKLHTAGTYSVLAPREALSSSPYALAVAAGAITNTEVSSTANILPSKIAGGAVTNGGLFQNSAYNFPNRVRIGDSTAPGYALEVNGDINIIGGTLPLPGGHRLLLDGGPAIFSNWTLTTGSNICRASHVGIGKAYTTTEPGAGTPSAALEVSGNINIVDSGALLLNGSAPVYSNWSYATTPTTAIYRANQVGVGTAVPATPNLSTYQFQVFDNDATNTVGITQGSNTGPLKVQWVTGPPAPNTDGYYTYAVYAP